jgi:hypothetical protein
MSELRKTEWMALRYVEALGDYEPVTRIPIRLYYEDAVEHPFYVWDDASERDTAIALRVHGLIECTQKAPYWCDEGVTVLVRDWWTKQPLGKLVCESDVVDSDLGIEETRC